MVDFYCCGEVWSDGWRFLVVVLTVVLLLGSVMPTAFDVARLDEMEMF